MGTDDKVSCSRAIDTMVIEFENMTSAHIRQCKNNIDKQRECVVTIGAQIALHVREDELARVKLGGVGGHEQEADTTRQKERIEDGGNGSGIMDGGIVKDKNITKIEVAGLQQLDDEG